MLRSLRLRCLGFFFQIKDFPKICAACQFLCDYVRTNTDYNECTQGSHQCNTTVSACRDTDGSYECELTLSTIQLRQECESLTHSLALFPITDNFPDNRSLPFI